MCLIAFSFDPDGESRLVLAANRDEYFARPTEPADFWPEAPQVLGGRDLEADGTWLGVTRAGRFAALTNFRDPADLKRTELPSRGALVRDFLTSDATPTAYLSEVLRHGTEYAGFNLLVGDLESAHCGSNRGGALVALDPGVHGLSNHLLDTPWPKVERARAALTRVLESHPDPEPEQLLALLADRTPPADAGLPDTGVGVEMERLLGPVFIETPVYGTRCSTALILSADGRVRFKERSHLPETPPTDRDFAFRVEPTP